MTPVTALRAFDRGLYLPNAWEQAAQFTFLVLVVLTVIGISVGCYKVLVWSISSISSK